MACIGTPAKKSGEKPFHVSRGTIRGFVEGDRAASQRPLGRLKHDAWTYWGHSGSPLFNGHGQVVGIHNSWDPLSKGMRHGVPLKAVNKFFEEKDVKLDK